MAGGGDIVPRSGTQATSRRRQHQKPSLPFDVMVDIAACSDPATLVRFAATCREARHRVAEDPTFRGRLRLRQTGRFFLPLLRGHLMSETDYVNDKTNLYMVDTAAADEIKIRKITRGIHSGPLASRDGLLLLREGKDLRVCDLDTKLSQILPTEPKFPGTTRYKPHPVNYVLLVGSSEGGGAGTVVSRHFQVLNVNLKLAEHHRCLALHIFSSEHNSWGRYTEIRTPNIHGTYLQRDLASGLVVGNAVYWLCLTNCGSYVLKLNIKAARVSVTMLPESFPQGGWRTKHLMAATSVTGSPIVLVGDKDKILAWVQSKQTQKWKQEPLTLVGTEAIYQAIDNMGVARPMADVIQVDPVWFAPRSGVVLVRMPYCGLFWLDLQSMKIVRWLADHWMDGIYCPYEIDLSSWVPTFTGTF